MTTSGALDSGWVGPGESVGGASHRRAAEGPLHRLSRGAWQAVVTIGVLSIGLGALILLWPGPTLVVAGVLFGVYLLASGALQVVAAFGTHSNTSFRVLAFISGALSILLGLFCFRGGPLTSLWLLGLWIGIGWLIRGIGQVVAAVSDRAMPARGWLGFFGVITVIAGVVLMLVPLESIGVLTVVTGIWLIALGIVEIITGIRVRNQIRQLPAAV